MTTAATDMGLAITRVPGIHGGRPIIAGTGVTVQRIAVWYKNGYSPEEIARKMSHLSLGQIHSAIAYYHFNQDAIDADIADEDAEYERLLREHSGGGPADSELVEDDQRA
ncbi:MAG: DUF433 domain-containing protein [Acidobacteriota bacterium]|nr:DUF433 domain-containing protein [Acidobacteriota bacterium]